MSDKDIPEVTPEQLKLLQAKDCPIIWTKGIEQFGSEDTLKQMLASYEDMTLNACLKKLYEALRDMSWIDVQAVVHNLKGTSGYIAAMQFHHKCDSVQYIIKTKLEFDENNQKKLKPLDDEEKYKIHQGYIEIMRLAKGLKTFLAKFEGRPVDVKDTETYINEGLKFLKERYPNRQQPQPEPKGLDETVTSAGMNQNINSANKIDSELNVQGNQTSPHTKNAQVTLSPNSQKDAQGAQKAPENGKPNKAQFKSQASKYVQSSIGKENTEVNQIKSSGTIELPRAPTIKSETEIDIQKQAVENAKCCSKCAVF